MHIAKLLIVIRNSDAILVQGCGDDILCKSETSIYIFCGRQAIYGMDMAFFLNLLRNLIPQYEPPRISF